MDKLAILLVILSSVNFSVGKSVIETSETFPFPKEDGTIIEARLKPKENEQVELGDINDAHFFLYTKNNPEDSDELILGDEDSIKNSHFTIGLPVKFIVHGFGASYKGFPKNLKDEYIANMTESFNIILLDWETLAESPDYFKAFSNAQLISDHCSKFLDFLVSNDYVLPKDIHLIGFSLGGQVVGQIGGRVEHKVGRITALDPALPLFDYASDYNKTTPDDADFVDVIHVAANGFLAYRDPCGTVDWYPNGGGAQPGCGIDPAGSCAHGRAPAIYIEAIFQSRGQFEGKECDSYENFLNNQCINGKTEILGEFTPKKYISPELYTRFSNFILSSASGVFYLKTKATSPYALGPVA